MIWALIHRRCVISVGVLWFQAQQVSRETLELWVSLLGKSIDASCFDKEIIWRRVVIMLEWNRRFWGFCVLVVTRRDFAIGMHNARWLHTFK